MASGLPTLQKGHWGLTGKNTIVGKCSLMAATAYNGQFCVIAALPSLVNFITFARW
ncbi:MAG: hypothetical protein FWC10_09640 [Lentimicrobiaceae bacterium]|nr:hypothetical protein [Lentimicrobiaceae bacterium]